MSDNIYDLIGKYRELKESSFYPFEKMDSDSEFFEVEKRRKRDAIEDLKNRITDYPNKYFVDQFRQNVINALDILLSFTKKNKAGFPLDRNQGLVIENYIFGKMAGVIKNSLKNGHGVSYGQFYYTVNGDFDETELRKLLEEFRDTLQNQKFKDFFELEDCVESHLNKLREMWLFENKLKLKQSHLSGN